MARRAEVNVDFRADDSQLQSAFDRVGSGARDMAADVDKSASRMRSSMDSAGGGIADAVDASEGKFRGLGDVIGGTGDVMDGFKDGNVAQMAMGMADLAGGFTTLVIPALTAMKTALLTGLAPAMTAISAHPLMAAILIGGAIIGGLILLEKKFGVVSGAVNWLKDNALEPLWGLFKNVFGWFESTWGKLVDIVKGPFVTAFGWIKDAWNDTVGGFRFEVPDWIPGVGGKGFSIPRMHSGGVVAGVPGSDQLRVLQAGETVLPRGEREGADGITINVAGSVITERDLGRIVADALRQNKLIGVTV